MYELLISVTLAIAISFLCSVMEAVLYSVPWSHIEHLRKSGRKSGSVLFQLRNNIDAPITAILTLNTVAHTAGAAFAGAAAAKAFGSEILGYFSAVFTLAVLVFSEVLPKTIGVMYNRPLSQYMARPLQWLVWSMFPVIWSMRFIVLLVGKQRRGPQTTEEDLMAVLSMTRREGIIKPHEELSIKNILSLDQKMVKEIMTPRTVVFSLPVNLTVKEAKATKLTWPHSRIPVYEKDDPEDVVGLIYRREILEALANDLDDLTLSELMKPINFVLETMTLDKVLVRFLESRTHLSVVLDEYGGMAGVVSLEDVLEEILGNEIVDETDQVVDMRELARMKRRKLISEIGRKAGSDTES
ncbi:MAG: hemolysin family protein [Desulfovibrionales bacterium]